MNRHRRGWAGAARVRFPLSQTPTMNMLRTACATLLACSLAFTVAAQPRFDFDSSPGRLSKAVVPSRYALTLTLDPDADRFGGEAVITLRVRQPVPAIVLHAHQLVARSATLADAGGERALTVQPDAEAQTWRLLPADGGPIAAGEYRLRLGYSGSVNQGDSGLYQSAHQVNGRPARMLATQLEAVFARMLFPGFDEPAFRAVFEIAVRAPKGYDVLSNMPESGDTDEGASRLHRFAPTPPMPSYLVAVAVGRFDALAGSAAGVPLRVFTAPGKREQAAYALAATQKLLPYYNDYFGLPYALPKLDLLAVPAGRNGAMEDWGLISFAEGTLLFDPATSNAQTQRRIFSIIAHEVSHQWFGNLVTAASWEEIWLNEAFATWMAEKAVDRFNPEWQTSLRRRQPIDWTMGRDAGPATRAIRSGAVLEDRVFDVFDGITYTKGGAVLSMLEQWIGPEAFRRGLAAYMSARRFSNATAGDLWYHIGQASSRDIAGVAASWTDQPGFPLVSVASRCEGGQTQVELVQRRFSTAGPASPALWKIPLVLLHGGQPRALLFDQARQSLALPGCPREPLLVNPGGEGFYRVAYEPTQQAALTQGFAQLPAAAQITLLSDTFALAQAGQLPMAAYVDLLAAVPRVQGPGLPALLAQARDGLAFLDDAFMGTPAQAALRAGARALLAPQLAALGWQARAAEDSEIETLRNSLIKDLARYDDAATIDQARLLFDADEAGRAALPPGIRSGVIHAVGTHADPARFARLMARLKTTQREEDRWLYASALASARDAALAQQVLELSLQGVLPDNIAIELPGLLAGNSPHGERAYRFTLEHWPALAERAATIFGARVGLLPDAAGGFNERERAQQLVADQQRLTGAPGTSNAARVAARIELLAVVKAREAQRLLDRLGTLAQRPLGS